MPLISIREKMIHSDLISRSSSIIMSKLIILLLILIQTIIQSSHGIPKKEYSSYRPTLLCKPSDYFRYPESIQDVQDIVLEAIARGVTVKAFGVRHSQTEIICTEGIPVQNTKLKFFQINADQTATFGSGVTIQEAAEFLRSKNRGLQSIPAFANITLGGAIGSGSHGSTIKYHSTIASQVVSLTVVDGLGQVLEIQDEEDLKSFRINLGLLGIVVRLTLQTIPLYKVIGLNYVMDDGVLTDGRAEEWARNTDHISIYWFPSASQVVVANWTHVDVNTPGNAYTNDHVPSTTDSFNILAKSLLEMSTTLTENSCESARKIGWMAANGLQAFMQKTLTSQVPNFVPIYTENGVTLSNPAVGYYYKMVAPTCIDGPNQSKLQCIFSHGNVHANFTILDNEISLALSDLPDFIQAIRDVLKKAPALFPVQGILMRFSASSSTYMSNSYGRDSVHFEFYIINRKNRYESAAAGLAAYQTIMQLLAHKFKGQCHWGKCGLVYQNQEMLDIKLDPKIKTAFVGAMNKFDPNGIFLNNFGKRLKGISFAQDLDPAITHCAILDDCFCKSNTDCPKTHTCTSLSGYKSYNVCQTIGETPMDFPPVLFDPQDMSITLWLTTTLSKLSDLAKYFTSAVGCILFTGPAQLG